MDISRKIVFRITGDPTLPLNPNSYLLPVNWQSQKQSPDEWQAQSQELSPDEQQPQIPHLQGSIQY